MTTELRWWFVTPSRNHERRREKMTCAGSEAYLEKEGSTNGEMGDLLENKSPRLEANLVPINSHFLTMDITLVIAGSKADCGDRFIHSCL